MMMRMKVMWCMSHQVIHVGLVIAVLHASSMEPGLMKYADVGAWSRPQRWLPHQGRRGRAHEEQLKRCGASRLCELKEVTSIKTLDVVGTRVGTVLKIYSYSAGLYSGIQCRVSIGRFPGPLRGGLITIFSPALLYI